MPAVAAAACVGAARSGASGLAAGAWPVGRPGAMETTYWLVALPLEGRLSRGAAGAEQVLKVLNDKTSPDLSTNYKARRAGVPPLAPRTGSHAHAPQRSSAGPGPRLAAAQGVAALGW